MGLLPRWSLQRIRREHTPRIRMVISVARAPGTRGMCVVTGSLVAGSIPIGRTILILGRRSVRRSAANAVTGITIL
eukprot:8934665-Heterocapsa_arctica.AAC.1